MSKYPFRVYQTQVEDHVFWIAKSSYLKGCVGQGDDQHEAIAELEDNEIAWIETASEAGIPIPAVPIETMEEYSGKMTLRLAPFVHMQASQFAKKEGISLNQYVNNAVVSQNALMTTQI